MDILVVGSGGREHAVIKALRRNDKVQRIYALPGNGGIAADAECFPIKATDIEGIVDFCKQRKVDFAVVTPDDPLVMGLVDRLEERALLRTARQRRHNRRQQSVFKTADEQVRHPHREQPHI